MRKLAMTLPYTSPSVSAAGFSVSVVKWRMCSTMKIRRITPPIRIVRDATVATCSSRFT
jgi:hypothetical protein